MPLDAPSGRLSDRYWQVTPLPLISSSSTAAYTLRSPMSNPATPISSFVRSQTPASEIDRLTFCVVMGNSGNSSPEFTIIKRSSASTTSYRASNSSDRVVAQKDTKGLRTRQLPPDFPALPALPVSPTPPIVPSPQFPDPGVLPIGSEASSKDASAPSS